MFTENDLVTESSGWDHDPVARFLRQASRAPEMWALRAGDGAYTYGELKRRVLQVAAALHREGVAPGDRVGVLLHQSRDLPAALMGVLYAGATYVPLDPRFPPRRLRLMLADAAVRCLLTTQPWADEIGEAAPRVLLEQLPVAEAPRVDMPPTALAYLIYTSGTTGAPKGVEITRGNLGNFLDAMSTTPGLDMDDILLAVTTVAFDIAVLELLLPLVVGAQVVIADEDEVQDGHALIDAIEAAGATVMQGTPATWKLLLAAGWRGDRRLRVLCGGESLESELARELLPRVAELWNLYGPTETTVWSTLDRVDAGPITIGRPIANTTVHVLDDQGKPVAPGVIGELWIGGAGVAAGYRNHPTLTAERFQRLACTGGSRLYRTGDLVTMLPDGRLVFHGRRDDQVKVRGFRVELGEVEAALRAHAAVRDAAAVVSDDRLIAYVVPATNDPATLSAVRSALCETLPPYMVPSVIRSLQRLPLTPNGKLDRRALLAIPDAAAIFTPADGVPTPRDARVHLMQQVWAEVLAHGPVPPDANFFELGGHSLSAMQLIARIEALTGHRMDIRAVFLGTLRDLAHGLPTVTGRRP